LKLTNISTFNYEFTGTGHEFTILKDSHFIQGVQKKYKRQTFVPFFTTYW